MRESSGLARRRRRTRSRTPSRHSSLLPCMHRTRTQVTLSSHLISLRIMYQTRPAPTLSLSLSLSLSFSHSHTHTHTHTERISRAKATYAFFRRSHLLATHYRSFLTSSPSHSASSDRPPLSPLPSLRPSVRPFVFAKRLSSEARNKKGRENDRHVWVSG